MKKPIIFLILLSVLQVAYGQVETRFFAKGDAFDQVKTIKDHPKANRTTKLPSFDVQKLIDEDTLNGNMDRPFRFGKGFDIGITLEDGEWRNVDEGRLWSMGFQSNGAYSINFVFDHFFLSESAKLYITNTNGTMLYGPVTSKQNTKNGYFLTDLIQGDDVTIYLYEPNSEKEKSKLTVRRVVHAYKNLFSSMAYGNLGGSESCNNDIACFPAWDEESDAVALVLLSDGTEWCTGSLLMTANQSFRPYFLSAFHCIDSSIPYGSLSATEISNAENWMFKFQYKMTSCGGSTATSGITYNGAVFRAAWMDSDFSLMEMNNSPLGDTQFTWLGWDRSGNTPTSGTGIHHPAGDVMKISFDVNQFQISSWNGTNNHWLLAFDDGVVQKGSSGSPILDQNDRVVGQLHGNQNYNPGLTFCEQSRAEYGRFNNSWTGGGTNITRLSNWLDPCGSGALTTNTSRAPYISGPSTVCSSGNTFTITNLPPVDSIIWTPGPNITISSGQNTASCKFSATGSGSSWVRARLVTGCGGVVLPQKTVWVGNPATPDFEIVGPVECNFLYVVVNSNYEPVTWSVTPPLRIVGPNTGYRCTFEATSSGDASVRATASNACGTVYSEQEIYAECLDLLLAPNPATDEVEVSIISESSDQLQSTGNPDQEFMIRIYNSMGNMVYNGKKSGDKTKVSTSSFKEGNYIVEVEFDKKVLKKQLIVKH